MHQLHAGDGRAHQEVLNLPRPSAGNQLRKVVGRGQAANDLKAGVLIGGEFFYAGARASAAPAWLAALQAKGREPVTLKGEHAGSSATRL